MLAKYKKGIETRRKNGTLKLRNLPSWNSKEHGSKIRNGMLKKYGVINPSQIPGHKEKLAKKRPKTWFKKYGYSHPLKHPKIKLKMLRKWLPYKGINGLEKAFLKLCPKRSVTYCSGKLFVHGPKGKVKTPDFIVIGQKKVIEVNSPYSHSEAITGQNRRAHSSWLKYLYRSRGYDCLVVWADKMKTLLGKEKTRKRILRYLAK